MPLQLDSKLLSIISHKMRTPLNSIIGFSELLLEGTSGDLNDKQLRYVNNVHLSGTHLLYFADEFIDYVYLKWGAVILDYSEFPLRQVINGAHMLNLDVIDKKGITMKINEDDRVQIVRGDELRLASALFHLLSNAVKFVSHDGVVAIDTHYYETAPVDFPRVSSEPFVTVSILDTGIGIRPEDQGKIFEEFYQVHGDITQDARGAGLGLWLARKIIDLHGGAVWVNSVRGEGSTFTVALPLT